MKNPDTKRLPDRWRRILQRHARGEDFRPATQAEGCSASYAAVIRTRMMKNPEATKFLESIRSDARREAVYGVVEAMAQAQKGIDLAERHKNPMAFIKGCELRAKLSGLLIDRVEVATVDLKGSLEQARTRVIDALNITPRQSCVELGPATDQAVNGAAYRGLGEQGNPFAE